MAVVDCIRYLGQLPPFTLLQNIDAYQCLMYGMEGSGKTTLLYKLKCPNWKKDQLIKEIAYIKNAHKDPAYHYEEFVSYRGFKYGVWDVPAQEIRLNLTNMFYKYLRISCVFFVVDTRQETAENMVKMEETRRLFEFLLNEDELRKCAFILIYNNFEDVSGNVQTSQSSSKTGAAGNKDAAGEQSTDSRQPYEDVIRNILGVEEVAQSAAHKTRFKEISLNCAEIHKAKWDEVLSHLRGVIKDYE